jgi:hypothetical protein
MHIRGIFGDRCLQEEPIMSRLMVAVVLVRLMSGILSTAPAGFRNGGLDSCC